MVSLRRALTGSVTAPLLLLSVIGVVPAATYLTQPAPGPALAGDQLVLAPGPGPVLPPSPPPASDGPPRGFSLRHVYHHGTYRHPALHRRRDVNTETDVEAGTAGHQVFLPAADGYAREELPPRLSIRSRTATIERLADRRPEVVDPMVAASRQSGSGGDFAAAWPWSSWQMSSSSSPLLSGWSVDDIAAPDITDKETVVNLAYISSDAYVEGEDGSDWEEVGGAYNKSADFGWQADGLRGHIWADDDNSTVVIGLKGTSPAVFDGDGTTTNDKVNDNLFFSCCCAQQGQWTWHKVCDCATDTYRCNETCVAQHLYEEHRYYTAARELYSNVTALYPDAAIWLTGHSLGGAVASLLGLTYGIPVVTFEAVPEALPARRLGLPVPPHADPHHPQARRHTAAWHFGHTADPIYLGTCNGATAACSFGGYALESMCHTGMECVYDVVADKGWRVGVGTHKIHAVIHDVLLKYDDVPECHYTPECRDCANWRMYQSNGTDRSTTTTTSMPSTTSKPHTRTETCQTPGWWGCLDPTTTADTTHTTSTASTSTSTCKTPGWFGCKDKTLEPTTTTMKATTTTTPTSPTTTCETPGWFGCRDRTSTTTVTVTTGTGRGSTTPPITSAPTPTPTSTLTPTGAPPRRRCLRRTWFGQCTKWEGEGEEEEGKTDEI